MRVDLEPIVVTAERSENQLVESTVAIATMDRNDIERLPGKTLTDIVAMMPGIGFISRDGDGRDALVTVRGFYGGGDVEYLVVLVDGLPQNDVETGLVSWDAIPTANIERIELLRGGSSSLYGDAAIGGVLNIVTRNRPSRGGLASLSAASYQSYSGSVYVSETLASKQFEITGNYDKTEGFRNHKPRRTGSANARLRLIDTETWEVGIRSANSWRLVDVAGPLLNVEGADRDYITAAFRTDFAEERRNALTIEGTRKTNNLNWRSSITGLIRKSDTRNTLALAAQFADTRDRTLDARRVSISSAAHYTPKSDLTMVFGVDAGVHGYESVYRNPFPELFGPIASFGSGEVEHRGSAARRFVGVYAQAEYKPFERVSITTGLRADGLWNSFEAKEPSPDSTQSATHSAVSPKIGVNVALVRAARARLNLYATGGTSFKSPAIDQLYSQRTITYPTEFGILFVSTSNGDLKPQRGSHVEGGLYGSLAGRHGRAELSATVYRIDMRDELDVDLATFQLVNIGRSRHDGVELGLNYYHPSGLSAVTSYTMQSTTFRNGDYAGKYVKAIPRDLYSIGLTQRFMSGLGVGATVRGRGRTYIDDPNTAKLEHYTAVDANASYAVERFTFEFAVFNLLNAEYNTTGYPDPSGGELQFLYPAAGTTFRAGVRYAW